MSVNAEPRDSTRRILEAACRVVSWRGAHALRMADVAREAGVSKPLLHYYFSSRTELLAQAFAYAEERVFARTEAVLAGVPTAGERLRRFLLLYVGEERVYHEDWILWNEVWSTALFDEGLRAPLETAYAGWVGHVVGLAREASEEGSVSRDVDVERAARRLAALVDGLGSQRLVGLVTHAEAADLVEEALELELGLTSRTAAGPA